MQNYRKTIGALAAASALVAGNASAEVEYEIHAGYTSEYIFRGQNLGTDLTEVGVDMATEYNGFGLSAGVWSASFHNANGNNTLTETDVYGEASKDLGFATAAVGYIYYFNFGTGSSDDAQEAYLSLAQTYFGVDFSLAYYYDIETDNDGYTALAASKAWELSPCLTLNTSSALGYAWEEGDFVHLTAKVALDYAFTETATITPFVAYAWALGEAGTVAKASPFAANENELVGGVMLAVSF